jgi:hypothetical protein
VSKGQSIARTKAKKTVVDGIEFGSQAEARRWSELRMLERGGAIVGLSRQPSYPIFNSSLVSIRYTADFEYWDPDSGRVAEEVKGMADAAYLLRRKMFVATHPEIALYEIRGKKRLRVTLTKGGLCVTRAERAGA